MSWKTLLFGDPNEKKVKKYRDRVAAINAFEDSMVSLSDDELKHQTVRLKERLVAGETLDAILPEAFATVREAAKRVSRLRHYDVQLIGGMILHDGNIAEMRTGEGKTLVSTLPAYLNALTGKSVHIVTVNDYLARRDAAWMGQIHAALGLTVSVINSTNASYVYDPSHTSKNEDKERDDSGAYKVAYEFLRPCTRPEAYAADIVYATNSELGFDYLRDNLETSAKNLRQGELAYAIVDEIDSILIDEARTPLIISGPAKEAERLYEKFSRIVRDFHETDDYTIDEKHRQVLITDAGIKKAEKALGIENLYTDAGMSYVHHLQTAVRAKALYVKDREYVVRDGKVVIVDEFTGRMQPGRRWSDGLHQAIEAKEGVSIEQESKTYASITYQNFFRMYKRLSGMTGTGMTSSEEFLKVYGLDVIAVPTNEPITRKDNDDLIFKTEQGKIKAVVRKVKELHEKGQPVLIGTASIEKNEILAMYLKKEGIPHELLNAKNHEREGSIIANAGRKGAVTVATNMAGRGVDIKLGGTGATQDEYEEVKSIGGLYVIGTERHEARRIDNQLRGRSGRQGDPGETQFFVSLEDNLMRVFANDMLKRAFDTMKLPEDEPIQFRLITKSLETAQTRIEGLYFDQRKAILEFDSVLNTQRIAMYKRRRAVLTGTDAELDEVARDICQTAGISYDGVVVAKREEYGPVFNEAMRRVILRSLDTHWMLHLDTMDYLRSSVNLRAYGQREPVIEYKKEGSRIYKEMIDSIARETADLLSRMVVTRTPKASHEGQAQETFKTEKR